MKTKKINQDGLGHVVLLALLVLVLVVGVAGWRVATSKSGTNQQASVETRDKIDELPDDLSTIKSYEEIQSLAKTEAADATISGLELETEDGKTVYIVYLSNGSVLVFDAFTGEVLDMGDIQADGNNGGVALPAGFIPGVTIQEAINMAKEKRPDSKLRKVEVSVEGGAVVYSVRFTDDSRVDINALNGVVQRIKDETGTDILKLDDESDDDEEDDEDNDGADDEDDDEEDDDDDDRSGSNSGSN